MTLVIAHRGSSAKETENSLAAFALAVREGADGIELDVHATADGVLVVHHDEALGGAPISGLPLQKVRAHVLTNGESIPTLAEALRVIAPTVVAFIEVKRLEPRSDANLLATIRESPAPDRCHVHSFDHRIVRRLRGALPESRLGALSCSYPVDSRAQLEAAGAGVLWQEQSLIDADLVGTIHAANARLIAWTVDDPARLRHLAALGVDGLCTNRPAEARRALS